MSTIGPYELIGKVAKTRHSTIWCAKDPLLDRDVALKQVDRRAGEQALREEATILASLDHPNIVRVYDILLTDTDAWLVQEWVNGASLGAVRDHSGKLSTQQAVGVVHGALHGLAYAHDRDVVHGDIAPGNILVDTDGTSRLVDFGSAAHTPPGNTPGGEAPARSSSGTGGYQSPEVADGHPAGKPSDVYSTAAVLADLLTKTPRHAADPDITASNLPSGLAPIGQVLRKALATDPTTRHPDAAALLAELDDAAERALGAGWLALAGTTGLVSATLGSGAVLIAETAATVTGTATAATAATAAVPLSGAPAIAIPVIGVDKLHAAAHSSTADASPPSAATAAPQPESVTTAETPTPAAGSPDVQQISYTEPAATEPDPSTIAPTTITPTAARSPKKWLAIGGIAAATVAVIVTAVVLTRNTTTDTAAATPTAGTETISGATPNATTGSITVSPSSTPTSSASPSPSHSPSPSPSPSHSPSPSPTPVPAPAGFNGTYEVKTVVTAGTSGGESSIGETETNTWTVTSPCTDASCTASITSTSGLALDFASTGGTFQAAAPSPATCVNTDTGEETGDQITDEATWTLTPTQVGGTVTTLTGESVVQQVESCPNQETELWSITRQLTVTRTGA